MDVNNQVWTRGVQYAASKGLGVVVMEPILGGRLVNAPESVQAIWDSATEQRKPAEWALQWVWDQPEVSVVLSGMSTMQHVTENVESAGRSDPGSLTAAESALYPAVRAEYQALCPIPYTKCEYCLPCTVGINIPQLVDGLNRGMMYQTLDEARHRCESLSEDQRTSACIQCRECESTCPQSIPISEWMVHVDEIVEHGMDFDAC